MKARILKFAMVLVTGIALAGCAGTGIKSASQDLGVQAPFAASAYPAGRPD